MSRQGYRLFECNNCHLEVKWPSRDCFSPSVEHCPECLEPMHPHDNEPRPDWPVDSAGNLTFNDRRYIMILTCFLLVALGWCLGVVFMLLWMSPTLWDFLSAPLLWGVMEVRYDRKADPFYLLED